MSPRGMGYTVNKYEDKMMSKNTLMMLVIGILLFVTGIVFTAVGAVLIADHGKNFWALVVMLGFLPIIASVILLYIAWQQMY